MNIEGFIAKCDTSYFEQADKLSVLLKVSTLLIIQNLLVINIIELICFHLDTQNLEK